jgi:hypothetical protein
MTALVQPQRLQVTNVRTNTTSFPGYPNGYRYITHVRAGAWSWSRQEVIDQIVHRRQYSFYTRVGGNRAVVIVVTERDGSQYIKTEGDDSEHNNLLSLPLF